MIFTLLCQYFLKTKKIVKKFHKLLKCHNGELYPHQNDLSNQENT